MIYISLKNELSKFLDGYEKLIILGIGNELKYDEGVGPYIISNLNNLQLNENILLTGDQSKSIKQLALSVFSCFEICLLI